MLNAGSIRWIGVTILVGLSLSVASTAWAQALSVVPGGVVRWPGRQLRQCGFDARRWQPLATECWYPVDLLQPAGPMELTRWQEDGTRETVTIQVGTYPYEVQHITVEDTSKVDLSKEDLERVERENRSIAALWSRESERRFELPLGKPLGRLPPGGRFGARRYFNNSPRSPHTGVDFPAAAGTPILSVAAGTVLLTGDFFFSGRSVFVDHGDGLISMYFHMSAIAVETGDTVDRGEVLGRVGQTGRATGPHLHFALRWHGDRIDPGLLLQPVAEVPALP